MTVDIVASAPAGPGLTRRRAIGVIAAAAGLPLVALGVGRALSPEARFHEWQGEALGAVASLSIWHPNESVARRAIAQTLTEVERLEGVFSLFQPDSELSRLNRDGAIARPSRDLVFLLEESQRAGAVSGGAFDPTVQPLWTLNETWFRSHPGDVAGPPPAALDAARARIDYRAIDVSDRRIAFLRAGMQATLNGIAQGYITDRVADILRNQGFDTVFVDLGETRALGLHPEGRAWRVGLRDPLGSAELGRTVEIADEAMAVSGGYGTVFEPTGRHHHIFDPGTGESASRYRDVAVIAPRATAADALAKMILIADEAKAPALLAAFGGTRAIVTRPDGSSAAFAPA